MKIILVPVMVMLIILIAFYLSMTVYYKQHFSFGTIINGYYCAGLSVEEANQKLLELASGQVLTIDYIDGTEEILLDDLEVSMDYSKGLEQKISSQNPFLWGMGMLFPLKIKVLPDILFDEENVERKIRAYDFMCHHIYNEEAEALFIEKDDLFGYILKDESKDLLDVDYTIKVIVETLHQGNFHVSLMGNNCYRNLPDNASMREIRQKYNAIAKFQDFSMVYHIGDDTELIDSGIVANWITLDEQGEIVFDEEGNPVLDRSKMEEYMKQLSAKYDNRIYTYNEYNVLLNAFLNGESGERDILIYG